MYINPDTKNLFCNRVFPSSCKHNRLVIRLYAPLLHPLRSLVLQLHANLPGSWRAGAKDRDGGGGWGRMEGERGRFVPRHQGHRRILLAFIIVIAMSTSAVQYYHLRRCLLRHCPSLHSPRSSSLYLTHTTTPRVDRFVNESRFSIEFWFCFGSLVFFDVSIEISTLFPA